MSQWGFSRLFTRTNHKSEKWIRLERLPSKPKRGSISLCFHVKGLGLLLGGANTAIKYLDVGASFACSNSQSGVIIIIIQMCLIQPSIIISRLAKPRVFCCQQLSLLSQYHGQLSAIKNLSLNTHRNNATSKLCFWESFWLNEMWLEIICRAT